jgi:hypothetical protein
LPAGDCARRSLKGCLKLFDTDAQLLVEPEQRQRVARTLCTRRMLYFKGLQAIVIEYFKGLQAIVIEYFKGLQAIEEYFKGLQAIAQDCCAAT